MRRLILLCLLGTATTVAAPAPTPPPASVHPVTDSYFGTTVVDNYRYMEDLKDPRVAQWMKAQADYTRGVLDGLPGRAVLLARMTELWRSTPELVTDLTIIDGRYYTLRLPAGARQSKLYVRSGAAGADRLLIDPETLAGGADGLLAIQWFVPSPDNRYVAYSLAAAGSEDGVLHILDTATGKELAETADRTRFAAPAWRADSRSFFYGRLQKPAADAPPAMRYQNMRVHLHQLGRAFDEDPVVLGRGTTDAAIPLDSTEMPFITTRSGSRWALAVPSPGTDPRVRVYAAPAEALDTGKASWRPIAASLDDEIGSVAQVGDTLYLLSRKDAPRGRIMVLDLAHRDAKPRVVVPQGEFPIVDLAATDEALYWLASDAGINHLRRLAHHHGAKVESPVLPYPAHVGSIITGTSSDTVMVTASSWIRSPAYLGRDAKTGAITDTGIQPMGPFDRADDLVAEEVKVTSWDGTRVPLSIVYRKGLVRDGSHPADLTGYGAYGISSSPFYLPAMLALLERGMVLATCHVRGGGEYGEPWHRAGFQASKPNTWKDFNACGDYLVRHGYTSSAKLGGDGASAGGVLIGRAIEQRPDLFAVAIAAVPVADTLRLETTANGVPNVPEFGSVKTHAGFKALHAMSPYANVKDGTKYPAVLVTTGINDPRVDAWQAAKLAARLQVASASGKPVLLRVDYAAGHGMGSSVDRILAGAADQFSFLLWQTGDPDFQPANASAD